MGMIKLPEKSVKFFSENYLEIFNSGKLAEGEWIKQVVSWTKSYTGASYAEAFNSNGAGIFAIMSVLKKFYGKSHYFIQSNTMYGVKAMAEASGLEYCGAVDCTLSTLMPGIDQVSALLKNLEQPKQTVFLITHIGGWVNPDIEEIVALCEEAGVVVIEDCAHSLGSTLNQNHTGLYGLAGVYSLYATKAIPVGEGGIMVTNNDSLGELVSRFIIYDRFEQEMDIGVNLRMSELNALLSYSVLLETESIIANKMDIAKKYSAACAAKGISFLDPNSLGQRSNLYKFILVDDAKTNCKRFNKLISRTSPVYDYCLGNDPEEIVANHICLPIWYNLEAEIVEKVVNEIESM